MPPFPIMTCLEVRAALRQPLFLWRPIPRPKMAVSLTQKMAGERSSQCKAPFSEAPNNHVARATWAKITDALAHRGVELVPEDSNQGAGARWALPRARRS
jgi:hypothetical protein